MLANSVSLVESFVHLYAPLIAMFLLSIVIEYVMYKKMVDNNLHNRRLLLLATTCGNVVTYMFFAMYPWWVVSRLY